MTRYFRGVVPAHVLNELERTCPWPLRRAMRSRRLCDLSHSYLRIDAFPGIEWARSPLHALCYAKTRLRPSAAHLALREDVAVSEDWAAGTAWARLPQGRRMLRWVMGRPSRMVTLHALRHAGVKEAG